MRFLLSAAALCALLFLQMPGLLAAPPQFAPVTPLAPGKALTFPRDFGAHPAFRTEWWYATGWLQTPDNRQIGFQITFFRSASGHGAGNPSSFAPTQLIIAHAALSDPAEQKLLHGEKSADRKSTRLNSSHIQKSRMPSSA